MSLSRRAFLGNIGKLAAAHAVPAPVLQVTGALARAPLTLVGAIGANGVKSVIDHMNNSWLAFYEAFDFSNYAAGVSESAAAVHETVTGHLNDHLPKVFSAIAKFREMKSKIVTGDPKVDENRIRILRDATEIKKKLYIENLTHLASLCPASEEEGAFSVCIDRNMSQEERQELYGDFLPDLQMRDLARRVTDIREELSNLADFPLFEAKLSLDELMKCALEEELVGDAFRVAGKLRSDCAYAAIEDLCKPANMCAETVDAFTNSIPMMLTDLNIPGLEADEIYELFDNQILFKSIASAIGNQADDIVWWLGQDPKKSKAIKPDVIDYIKNRFVPTVHDLYKQHFAAAMPDILEIPLPALQKSITEFSAKMASAIEETATTTASEETATATLETESIETGMDFSRLSAPLRLVTANLASKDVASPSATNGDALATPAPAIHSSATALTETAGITLQRPGKTGQATQTPAP